MAGGGLASLPAGAFVGGFSGLLLRTVDPAYGLEDIDLKDIFSVHLGALTSFVAGKINVDEVVNTALSSTVARASVSMYLDLGIDVTLNSSIEVNSLLSELEKTKNSTNLGGK